MKHLVNVMRILLLLAVLAAPASTVQAQGPGGDVVLFGQNYTLEKGQELNGSLAVIGGNVSLEEASRVDGDLVVVGGNLKAQGSANGDVVVVGGNLILSEEVDGDIVIVGGQAELTETAVVNGDIVMIGGQLDKDPKAEISGQIINNTPLFDAPNVPDVPDLPELPDVPDVPNLPDLPDVPDVPDLPSPPDLPSSPPFAFRDNPFLDWLMVLVNAVAVSLIGMLLSLFFQTQFERVGDAILKQPFLAGSFGLLVCVVTPLALLILVVTILLIPVALVVGLMIPLAWLFGVIALGQEIGDRFTRAINQTWAPVLSTGLGTFMLMLLGGFFRMVPCVGWLVPFLVAMVGMGGVAMTWFGTRVAPGSVTTSVEVPPAA
jgi:hypothetical protein